MIYPVYTYGTKVLREKTKNIDKDFKGLEELINDMFSTMHTADGVGLAAPQIGKSLRLFVVDATPLAKENPEMEDFKMEFINPVITERSGEVKVYTEGCLSLPGISEDVKRENEIVISYMDKDFNKKEEKYTGVKARILQHEYDHLEGILFVDRLNVLKKKMLKSRLNNIIKGKVDIKYKAKFAK